MKDFQHRIRQETKITLRDELIKLTKTSQKKKEHMKAKKMKKKLQKQAVNGQGLIGGRTEEENDVINRDFNQRHDGLLRPSDLVRCDVLYSIFLLHRLSYPFTNTIATTYPCHFFDSFPNPLHSSIPWYDLVNNNHKQQGAPSFFPKTDVVLFGERVEQPPDLKMLGKQLKKRKDRPTFGTSFVPPEEDKGNMDGSDDDDGAGDNKRIKRCKANRLDLDALEGNNISMSL